jgi:hypothetical protein
MFNKKVFNFEEIKRLIVENQYKIICIDGDDGAGKTRLAKKIINNINNYYHINIDNYLIKNRGRYFKEIKFSDLKQEIYKLKEKNKQFIIEGVVLLKILKKIKIKQDLLIYVFEEQDDFDDYFNKQEKFKQISLKEIIKLREIDLKKLKGIIKDYKINGLDKELITYKKQFNPAEKADVIYITETNNF